MPRRSRPAQGQNSTKPFVKIKAAASKVHRSISNSNNKRRGYAS